jgi:hypothetical protein
MRLDTAGAPGLSAPLPIIRSAAMLLRMAGF